MRREQRGRGASGQCHVQFTFGGNEVKRVGVEHQRHVERAGVFKQGMRLVTGAHARAAGQRRKVGREKIVCRAQHELRLHWVKGCRLFIDQASIDAATAQMKRRAGGQQCGTDHAVRTAKDTGVAKSALVAVALSCFEKPGKQVAFDRTTGRNIELPGVEIERGNGDFTAMVRAVGGVQPRLAAQEGDRVAGTDRFAMQRACIRVQPARAIERQQRAEVACSERVGLGHQMGIRINDITLETDAEQPVDDQRPLRVFGDISGRYATGVGKSSVRRGGVRGQIARLSDKDDVCVEKAVAQQAGGLEGVTTVVAGAGQNEDSCAPFGTDCHGEVGCRPSGTLHERLVSGGCLDLAQVGRAEESGHGFLACSALWAGQKSRICRKNRMAGSSVDPYSTPLPAFTSSPGYGNPETEPSFG